MSAANSSWRRSDGCGRVKSGRGVPPLTPIVGVSGAAQLEEALAGAALVLPRELRARLDAAA
ncbi:hypothetical protein [Microtetraspora fusca]|uniref:Uncharacterized protein n=1 Tax=Microtetraspora fusca TaxID=1997 RepID=A0ABW6VFU6_MICFU|nr:hypothetical protein [Microtetraspora fusca]